MILSDANTRVLSSSRRSVNRLRLSRDKASSREPNQTTERRKKEFAQTRIVSAPPIRGRAEAETDTHANRGSD
jgi:hypothetical protein